MSTLRRALLSMGYTERKPGHWLKPIGYQCFSYHESRNEWCNWYLDGNGKIDWYESKKFEDDHYLLQLKEWECWTRTDMYVRGESTFEMGIIDI